MQQPNELAKPESGRIISIISSESEDYYFAKLEQYKRIANLENAHWEELNEEEKALFEEGLEEALCSYIDSCPSGLEVFEASEVRDYLAKLLERCESEKSLEEVKAILKDGLAF